MRNLIRLTWNRLRPAEQPAADHSEDPSSMADLVRLLEAQPEQASARPEEAAGQGAAANGSVPNPIGQPSPL